MADYMELDPTTSTKIREEVTAQNNDNHDLSCEEAIAIVELLIDDARRGTHSIKRATHLVNNCKPALEVIK